MNIICVAGNIGKDAELRYLPDGNAVANFSVADSQGRDKEPIWWNCQLFGKRAESLSPHLIKGQQVTITGQVIQRMYTNKNGQEKVSTDVRIGEIALQGKKKEEPQNNFEDRPPF